MLVFASFPAAVTKYPVKNKLREKALFLLRVPGVKERSQKQKPEELSALKL